MILSTGDGSGRGRGSLSGEVGSLGGRPVPGQEIGDAGEHVGEVALRVAAVELGGLDQGVDRGGAAAAGIGAGEQVILAADRNRPVIMPMSGKRSRSIIAGTHSMGSAFGVSVANSA